MSCAYLRAARRRRRICGYRKAPGPAARSEEGADRGTGKLQRELARLTDAIASGSGSDTVMSRIQQNERSVREIERELRGIAVPPLDEREVEAILRETLTDWRVLSASTYLRPGRCCGSCSWAGW